MEPEPVQAAVDAAAEADGGLRISVCCAGIGWAQRTAGKQGPHDLEVFHNVIKVNLIGTFNVLRLACTAMNENEPDEEGERGVCVNTASIAAFDGQIGQVAYSASKGGIVGLTLPAARDMSSRGIRVCTIAPGLFDTPLLAALPEEPREALGAGIPFPSRLGRPEEYAQLASADRCQPDAERRDDPPRRRPPDASEVGGRADREPRIPAPGRLQRGHQRQDLRDGRRLERPPLSRLPHEWGFALALGVDVPWDETNQTYSLSMHVEDPDGELLGDEFSMDFEAGRPPGSIQGSDQRIVVSLQTRATFSAAGPHAVVIKIEDAEIGRSRFYVVQVPQRDGPTANALSGGPASDLVGSGVLRVEADAFSPRRCDREGGAVAAGEESRSGSAAAGGPWWFGRRSSRCWRCRRGCPRDVEHSRLGAPAVEGRRRSPHGPGTRPVPAQAVAGEAAAARAVGAVRAGSGEGPAGPIRTWYASQSSGWKVECPSFELTVRIGRLRKVLPSAVALPG